MWADSTRRRRGVMRGIGKPRSAGGMIVFGLGLAWSLPALLQTGAAVISMSGANAGDWAPGGSV